MPSHVWFHGNVTTKSGKQACHSKLRSGENKNNLKRSLLKFIYAYEKGHCTGWKKARVIQIEPYNIHTKLITWLVWQSLSVNPVQRSLLMDSTDLQIGKWASLQLGLISGHFCLNCPFFIMATIFIHIVMALSTNLIWLTLWPFLKFIPWFFVENMNFISQFLSCLYDFYNSWPEGLGWKNKSSFPMM